MDCVCDFIINNNTKNIEYFEIEEDHLDDINDMLEYAILKLVSILSTDILIIEKFIDDYTIYIKFSYKEKQGYLSNTYNSRGYQYWVVSVNET